MQLLPMEEMTLFEQTSALRSCTVLTRLMYMYIGVVLSLLVHMCVAMFTCVSMCAFNYSSHALHLLCECAHQVTTILSCLSRISLTSFSLSSFLTSLISLLSLRLSRSLSNNILGARGHPRQRFEQRHSTARRQRISATVTVQTELQRGVSAGIYILYYCYISAYVIVFVVETMESEIEEEAWKLIKMYSHFLVFFSIAFR